MRARFTHGLWARVPSTDAVSANYLADIETPVHQLMPIARDDDAAMLRQAPNSLRLYALKCASGSIAS